MAMRTTACHTQACACILCAKPGRQLLPTPPQPCLIPHGCYCRLDKTVGMPCTQWAVRTQCKVLYVGKYSNPSFGPLGEHLMRHTRGACAVPRAIRGVVNLAPNTKLGEVQQDTTL